MARLALGLALVAVALSAWAAIRSPGGSDGVAVDGGTALDARLAAIEARLNEALAARPTPLPGREAPRAAADLAASPAVGRPGLDPETLATRLAEVDKRLASVEGRIEEKGAAPSGDAPTRFFAGSRGGPALAPQGIVTSLDDAEARFSLSASQRADWERALEDARRELDTIHGLPDQDGKTWKQHQEEAMKSLESGRFDLGRLLSLRARNVPGRDETYGEAEQRVRAQTKKRLRDALTQDQQKKYDESFVDPLIGGGPGFGAAVSFTTINAGPDGARPSESR